MQKMGEKEAIEALKLQGGLEITGKTVRVAKFFEGLVIAEEALEEIQQYRATGLTPTMVKDLIKSCKKHEKHAMENAHIVDEYSAIGTLEECREAVERMKPKKYVRKGGNYDCPVCGYFIYTISGRKKKYCDNCGQAIDWSE